MVRGKGNDTERKGIRGGHSRSFSEEKTSQGAQPKCYWAFPTEGDGTLDVNVVIDESVAEDTNPTMGQGVQPKCYWEFPKDGDGTWLNTSTLPRATGYSPHVELPSPFKGGRR